jgi:hypothetical protein
MRVPRLASNLGATSTRLLRLIRLLCRLLRHVRMAANNAASQTSSSQRSNDGIKSLTGIVWFELYVQATLSAIQEYA